MPNYRRADTPGAAYFFTVVSYQRQPVLCDNAVRAALRKAITTVKSKHSFTINAWVLLPDHLHCVWTLPEDDHAYSVRWSMIKRLVTQAAGDAGCWCAWHILRVLAGGGCRCARRTLQWEF